MYIYICIYYVYSSFSWLAAQQLPLLISLLLRLLPLHHLFLNGVVKSCCTSVCVHAFYVSGQTIIFH